VEKELIIHAAPAEIEMALLENGKLVELHHQKTNSTFSVGDIFLGKVRKQMPGLNAASSISATGKMPSYTTRT
jgi:Ribonucleases G and E